jgi:hypothetical protein
MKSVEDLAREIIAREGGFSNDPADPGGPTNHGVTLTTLRRLGHDLTGDGRTDLADVKALTPDKAVAIYTEHYFRRPRLSELPEALQPSIFDMYVNAGANAVRLLQRLLIDLGLTRLPRTARLAPPPSPPPKSLPSPIRCCWPTPMASRGATTITGSPTRARRCASSPAVTAARAAGSPAPKISSRRAST